MDDTKARQNVLVGSQIATALGVSYLALKKEAQAAPTDVSGILAKLDVLIAAIEALAIGGNGEPVTVVGYPLNTNSWRASVIPFPAVAQAVWLPNFEIPDGFAVALKAAPTNAGMIQLAPNAADCINANQAWPLMPNEAITLNIKNTNLIYASATAAGDQLHLAFEVRQG